MSAGAQRPPLASAAADALAPGLDVPVAAGEAPALGFAVVAADDTFTVGLRVSVGEGLAHGLPYAADGRGSPACVAAADVRPADAAADRTGRARVNIQASTPRTARPTARMRNRRRQ